MKRLFVTRHGRTPLNAQGVVQGPWLDPSLDDLGREQARRLALRLGGGEVGAVLASPLRRAVETAEPTAEARDVALYEDPRLCELDWGAWNGRRKDADLFEDIRALSARWTRGEASASPPGGESAGEALRRASAALEEALAAAPEGDVLVVAHGRLNKILLSWLVHGDLRHQEDFPAANAGLTVLVPAGRRWRVSLLDCRAHLATLSEAAPGLAAADA